MERNMDRVPQSFNDTLQSSTHKVRAAVALAVDQVRARGNMEIAGLFESMKSSCCSRRERGKRD